jgi:hypothetical protein
MVTNDTLRTMAKIAGKNGRKMTAPQERTDELR